MKKGLALIAAILFTVCALSIAQEPTNTPDLEGIYSVVGKDITSEYTGCAIIRKHGDRYLVQSCITGFSEGQVKHMTTSRGAGILQGDTLSFAWKNGEGAGVTVYQVTKDGLRGSWTAFPGPKDICHETLKKIGPLPKPQLDL